MPDANAQSPLISTRSREHPVEIAARVELVKIAFGELASGTVASAGTTLAFALVLATRLASGRLWFWLAVMLAIAAYRLWLSTAFRRLNPPPPDCPRWALRLVVASTLTALGWGLSAWVFPTLVEGGPLGVVHVFVLAGITTGSTRLLLPMRKGSVAYLVAAMGPVALRFFAEADLVGAALGGCTVFFVIYMGFATLRNHRAFSDAIVLRLEREALAAELTAENARREQREAELREARERAEAASRAKGEFLATISHEIRTPMNGVLGMLRVLRETPLTDEQLTYSKTASDSAEALLALLNDVLDFSKIEAGRLELEHLPYSPAAVVRSVADMMQTRARDKRLEFEVRLEQLPEAVIGDPVRLRQILLNLVGNAIKFTEHGRVELAASGTQVRDGSTTIRFSVKDTGIGIDPAVINRLFKPFSQADTSMSRRYGGTGLGLAICQRLAGAMGGTVEVESQHGRGSNFTLILPCQISDRAATNRAPEAAFVSPSLRGRVLVVEDDAVNQQVIDLFLKKMALAPVFSGDGESAIATATREPFDVVLMDCQLPGIDGLEATRRIRERVNGRPLRIIALTANANTDVRDACLAAGMDDFLTKPVQLELLAEVLQRNLPKTAS